MASVRGSLLFVVALVSTVACHRYEPVTDLKTVVGTRGRLFLSAEGRAGNARRLGGVAMDVTGVLIPVAGDSVGIRADAVRFSDLGTVPFAQGELHFAARDVESVSREVFNRKKTTIVSVLALLGAVAIGQAFAPGSGFLGFGRSDPPTPR